MGKFQKIWFPLISYSVIIFCGSSIPNWKPADSKLPLDKIIHALEYSIFGYLLGRVISDSKPNWAWQKIWLSVILGAFLYGLSDEFHQAFVPGRTTDIFDALADAVGGLIGGITFIILLNKRKNGVRVSNEHD